MKDDAKPKVLLVDDEPLVMQGLKRTHHRTFDFTLACGPEEGLEAVNVLGPFSVVVSDYEMPVMNGAAFLEKVSEAAPDTVRIMLTGQGDLRTAVDAVNRGNIFRFLTKPCEPEVFAKAVSDGVELNRLRRAEQLVMEETVAGCVEVLAEVLSLVSPAAFGRTSRVLDLVKHVVSELELPDGWQYETAARLSQLGCVAVPSDVFQHASLGQTLSAEEQAMLDRHPELGSELLRKIPRLQSIAEMVHLQRSADAPDLRLGREVRMGSRILRAAVQFEELLTRGADPRSAHDTLKKSDQKHDVRVLRALESVDHEGACTRSVLVPFDRLQPDMVLFEDIRTNDTNALVISKGHHLTESSLERLRNYRDLGLLSHNAVKVVGTDLLEGEGKRAAEPDAA